MQEFEMRAWLWGAAWLLVTGGGATAAAPGVPSLSSTPNDFVAYAVDNLPAHYQRDGVVETLNTPDDNPITNAGAELGRVLFYDPRLSHSNGTSCASCHVQENGFGDPNELSEGFAGGLTGRHSPGLSNAAYYARGRFFWDERAETLEEQVLMPIQDPVEMGSDLGELVEELAATEFYPLLFERAFGDSEVTTDRMAASMAQFVRSMVSYQSRFDEALEAGRVGSPGFVAALTQQENQGHELFAANCATCHGTNANVAARPENIGLDLNNADDAGVNGRFKVASLRNIAVRGSFMHDGRFSSLEEVVEHYSSGILANPTLGPNLPVGGFGFTHEEKAALVAFMEALTDEAFLSEEIFSDPFVALVGDYNGDGVVDIDDYQVWRDDFGQAPTDEFTPLMADGNDDGVVDLADYALWRDNLGASWDDGLATAVSSVPEPAGVVLAFGLPALWPRRRARRGRG